LDSTVREKMIEIVSWVMKVAEGAERGRTC
jgi:hypothetical protein